MAKSKKAAKANTKAPKADTSKDDNAPEQERPRPKTVTRTEVQNLNDEAQSASDPYNRKPKTKTREVDGRATLKTRI